MHDLYPYSVLPPPSLPSDLKGYTFGVFGAGISGLAMLRHLKRRHAFIKLFDHRQDLILPEDLRQDVICYLGPWDRQDPQHLSYFDGLNGLCLSPGIHPLLPEILHAATKCPLYSELSLAGPISTPIVAITGTNGKSTTAAMVAHFFKTALQQQVFLGGNFGIPLLSYLDDVAKGERVADVLVLELSSYQLENIGHFQVDVAVLLNLTADHMARYQTMQRYATAKQQIIAACKPQGCLVLCSDDPWVVAMAKDNQQSLVAWFGKEISGLDGMFVKEDHFTPYGFFARWLEAFSVKHPWLLGQHNQQNTMAALLAVAALENRKPTTFQAKKLPDMTEAYQSFQGLAHRLEYVADVHGLTFINDSKATNDSSTAIAIGAMAQKSYILLLGGQDKATGYDALAIALQRNPAAYVIAFGAARLILQKALQEICQSIFKKHQKCQFLLAEDMQAALSLACQKAVAPMTILLSPSCASFDAFRHYEHRGQCFKQWVKAYAQSQNVVL